MGVTGNTIVCGALFGGLLLAPPAIAQTPQPSVSQPAQLPAFLDSRRLDSLEAAREAAEEEARRRAAKRQRRNEEAEARRASEAEVKRKAEEVRRLMDEAEARRRREENAQSSPGRDEDGSRVGASWLGTATFGTATAAGFVVPSPGTPCPPASVATSPLPAGRMSMTINSPCRAGREFQIVYGRFAFSRALDFEGRGRFVLDLFQGTSEPIALAFSNEDRRAIEPEAQDLDKVSKIAVVWQAPVNLDLHAFEYAAARGEPGHVWAGAPSSYEAARLQVEQRHRGAGFLSTSDEGKKEGAKVEVYTFLHHEEQNSGAVTLALDYETRGTIPASESCGSGRNAEIALDVIVLERTGAVRSETALVPAAACGEALPDRVRYNDTAVPDLRWRR